MQNRQSKKQLDQAKIIESISHEVGITDVNSSEDLSDGLPLIGISETIEKKDAMYQTKIVGFVHLSIERMTSIVRYSTITLD